MRESIFLHFNILYFLLFLMPNKFTKNGQTKTYKMECVLAIKQNYHL